METELWSSYLGTVRRKRRQQTSYTYCYRATSRLYRFDLGLVMQDELLLLDCAVQAVLQHQRLRDAGVHLRLVEHDPLAGGLGSF